MDYAMDLYIFQLFFEMRSIKFGLNWNLLVIQFLMINFRIIL